MKRILFTLLVLVTFLTWPAQAQDLISLSSLDISLWPEFDRPEVLVIYRGVVADETSLPAPLEIYIPARVGQPTAVAYVDVGGQRFNQQYTTRVEGEWLVVSFELAASGFQLEYYDAMSIDSSGKREYTYTYAADYSVSAMTVDVQEPPTAEAFELDPPADSVAQQTDGLTYHLFEVEDLEQGEKRTWTFRYQKDNADLTAGALGPAATPAQTAPPSTSGEDNSTVWLFLVAFVALVAVGAGAFWLGRRTSLVDEAGPPQSKRHKRRGSGQGATAQRQQALALSRDESLFCYRCGTELRSDSEFCHKCGAARRD
jgi:hypothetical protein